VGWWPSASPPCRNHLTCQTRAGMARVGGVACLRDWSLRASAPLDASAGARECMRALRGTRAVLDAAGDRRRGLGSLLTVRRPPSRPGRAAEGDATARCLRDTVGSAGSGAVASGRAAARVLSRASNARDCVQSIHGSAGFRPKTGICARLCASGIALIGCRRRNGSRGDGGVYSYSAHVDTMAWRLVPCALRTAPRRRGGPAV